MIRPRIVVTGVGGAVGGELVSRLVTRGLRAELVGVFSSSLSRDAFLARADPAVTGALRPVVCDLADPAAVATLARALKRPAGGLGEPGPATVVVHAAANVSWTATAEQAWLGNVAITRNTAGLARSIGCGRFVFVSSAYTATTGWEYRNTYEESKAAAERMLKEDFADLRPAVFSCSLVVGHSLTGAISRFHGIYPLLGVIDRYQPPFLPGDRHATIDIVPVDWVAQELSLVTEQALAGAAVPDVVAAAGAGAPALPDLIVAAVAALNRGRQERDEPAVPEVPLVPFRRWDFLKRSIEAWKIPVTDQRARQNLYRLIDIYRPYLENAHVRPPLAVSVEPPPWRDYVDVVVERWVLEKGRRRQPAVPAR